MAEHIDVGGDGENPSAKASLEFQMEPVRLRASVSVPASSADNLLDASKVLAITLGMMLCVLGVTTLSESPGVV